MSIDTQIKKLNQVRALKVSDFTTLNRISCRGCYFFNRDYSCTKESNQNLLNSLFELYGDCSRTGKIFILRYIIYD